MTKPFEVHECKHGVEIRSNLSRDWFGGDWIELLTIEEAEDLAHQLLDAARKCRVTEEDDIPWCIEGVAVNTAEMVRADKEELMRRKTK